MNPEQQKNADDTTCGDCLWRPYCSWAYWTNSWIETLQQLLLLHQWSMLCPIWLPRRG